MCRLQVPNGTSLQNGHSRKKWTVFTPLGLEKDKERKMRTVFILTIISNIHQHIIHDQIATSKIAFLKSVDWSCMYHVGLLPGQQNLHDLIKPVGIVGGSSHSTTWMWAPQPPGCLQSNDAPFLICMCNASKVPTHAEFSILFLRVTKGKWYHCRIVYWIINPVCQEFGQGQSSANWFSTMSVNYWDQTLLSFKDYLETIYNINIQLYNDVFILILNSYFSQEQ